MALWGPPRLRVWGPEKHGKAVFFIRHLGKD